MFKNDSKKKKNSIMQNIQKLRNEIEEIRIQNLTLLENLKPYEQWYEETKEILFSSSKIRRRSESSQSRSLLNRLSKEQEDSSSSLSPESSDSDSKSQTFENQENSDYDEDDFIEDDFIEEDQSETKNTASKQTKSNDFSSQNKYISNLTPFFQNFAFNASKNMFNPNTSNNINHIANSSPLQNNHSISNLDLVNTNQNQMASILNNQLNINRPLNQSNFQYTFPTELHKKDSSFQNIEPKYYASNQLVQSKTSPYRISPKISQIGTNSMLSNVVSHQKNTGQADDINLNTQTPQRMLQKAPLSKNFLYIPAKNTQTKNEKLSPELKSSPNSHKTTISSIINKNYNSLETNLNNFHKIQNNMKQNKNEIDIPNTKIFDTADTHTKPEENSYDEFSDFSFNSFININDEDSKKEKNILNVIEENQFNFLIDPPPIPEIHISNQQISNSSKDEEQLVQNKQQIDQKTVLTPRIKISLT